MFATRDSSMTGTYKVIKIFSGWKNMSNSVPNWNEPFNPALRFKPSSGLKSFAVTFRFIFTRFSHPALRKMTLLFLKHHCTYKQMEPNIVYTFLSQKLFVLKFNYLTEFWKWRMFIYLQQIKSLFKSCEYLIPLQTIRFIRTFTIIDHTFYTNKRLRLQLKFSNTLKSHSTLSSFLLIVYELSRMNAFAESRPQYGGSRKWLNEGDFPRERDGAMRKGCKISNSMNSMSWKNGSTYSSFKDNLIARQDRAW